MLRLHILLSGSEIAACRILCYAIVKALYPVILVYMMSYVLLLHCRLYILRSI